MSEAPGDALRVGGVDATLLARSRRGDGRHRVVSARLGGRDVVLKLYGRKRAALPTLARAFGHRYLVAKTGLGPRIRRATEARLLALWRAHGCDVPEVLDVALPEPIDQPYLVLERIEGPTLETLLRDPSVPRESLEADLRRFAADWARRHALAERLGEPGLVHAHPGFAHLIASGGRLVAFDFEYAYTDPRRVARLVSVEIGGFVASLRRASGARFESLLRALVSGYPDRERLARAVRDASAGRFPALDALPESLRAQGPRKLREGLTALERELTAR
jgi:tRNA A-37 threonylcarbamoyl transferase component Bud32